MEDLSHLDNIHIEHDELLSSLQVSDDEEEEGQESSYHHLHRDPSSSASSSARNTPRSESSSQSCDNPRQLYSQRLGRFVNFGECTLCGGPHIHKNCELRKYKEGQVTHSRHISGRITLVAKSMRSDSSLQNELNSKARRVISRVKSNINSDRPSVVRWLLSHWDATELRSGGVLDVAGGQGKVATEIQLRHRIPCTVIDPRSVVFTEKQLKFLTFQQEHPDKFLPGTPQLPSQLQMLFEDDFLDKPEHKELWDRANLVIGLHPDEATERIIQFCLKSQKDFAVLPCCVFPTKFVSSIHMMSASE